MRKHLLLIICLVMAQQTIGLSQILRFEEVTRLPPSINSDAEESMPLISSDGQAMYFVRSFYKGNRGGKFAGQDIWVSKKDSLTWTKATNQLGLLNNKKNNAIIGLTEDNKTLYLLDSYGGTVHGIAFSRFFNGKWLKPENIPIKGLSKEGFKGFYMNPSYDVLLISMNEQGSYGEEDIYVSLKDSTNRWSEPRNLGTTINSAGFEISPFLSKDKKFLFFSSNGHSGFGDADIFISERLYNDSWDVWSVPQNLGPVINSVNFDAYFSINKDSVVYFSSNRTSDQADIYSSSFLIQKKDVSQARIDSLIKEANSYLEEIRDSQEHNTGEILVFYEYNEFEMTDKDKRQIEMLLDQIDSEEHLIIQLTSFSYEEYSDESKRLIEAKREQEIRNFLEGNGISSVDIVNNLILDPTLGTFKKDNVGGVKIKISY